jgi:imidazole glycerol-phosphate synthase subunit HisH
MPKPATIAIIDYRMGNLRSVQKAIEYVGGVAHLVNTPEDIASADKLILPGVGAFGDGMRFLNDLGLSDPIRDFVTCGRPMLGVCLGMQLLFDGSQEDATPGVRDGLIPGLCILPGRVVKFDVQRGGQRLKVPQMGWNSLHWDRPDPLMAGIEQDSAVYFVHSYYAQPDDDTLTSTQADYGGDFCASIHKDNLFATQFHPEKSQRVGLRILSNFVALSG